MKWAIWTANEMEMTFAHASHTNTHTHMAMDRHPNREIVAQFEIILPHKRCTIANKQTIVYSLVGLELANHASNANTNRIYP